MGNKIKSCIVCEDPTSTRGRCDKHYRFFQMRGSAKRRGKEIPTFEQINQMFAGINNMICPICDRTMVWLKKNGNEITLQHDLSGKMKSICSSCNSRHSQYPGDSFYTLDPNFKVCNDCNKSLPTTEFHSEKHLKYIPVKSYCKKCGNIRKMLWQSKNRYRYNAWHREYRARRKAEGRPIKQNR